MKLELSLILLPMVTSEMGRFDRNFIDAGYWVANRSGCHFVCILRILTYCCTVVALFYFENVTICTRALLFSYGSWNIRSADNANHQNECQIQTMPVANGTCIYQKDPNYRKDHEIPERP